MFSVKYFERRIFEMEMTITIAKIVCSYLIAQL